jgi:hypothetical protein
MDAIGKLLTDFRTDFGWGGLLALLGFAALLYLAYWLGRNRGGTSASATSTSQGGSGNATASGGNATGGSALATGGSANVDLHIHVSEPTPAPAAGVQSQARPRIVFTRIRQTQLNRRGIPLYFVCQIWFKNEPHDGSVAAESLNAFMTFAQPSGAPVYADLRGEWAITNATTNAAFDRTVSTWSSLPSNGDEVKLIVAQKRTEDVDAYVWLEGAKEYDGRRHPSYRIAPGSYQLNVRIRSGNGVDQQFVFRLYNPGGGGDPAISGPF